MNVERVSVLIRAFEQRDQDAFNRLVVDTWHEFGVQYNLKNHPDLRNAKNHYCSGGGTILVAVSGDELIGAAAVKRKGDVAILKRLYVRKEFRGAGIGYQLFLRSWHFCLTNGFSKVELITLKCFEDAISLYTQNDFRIVKTNATAITMEREL